jgi:tetratricopeptide (TPR) repeat protein
MKRTLAAAIVAISLLPISAFADDSGAQGTSSPAAPSASTSTKPSTSAPATKPSAVATFTRSIADLLVAPRKMIADKNFTEALAALKVIDKAYPNNADVNNLLGYSSRNLNQYTAAGIYYSKALKIDPKHLGALEYQGVLFLKTKKLALAKANLAKLKSFCGVSCEEYQDLLKEIGTK